MGQSPIGESSYGSLVQAHWLRGGTAPIRVPCGKGFLAGLTPPPTMMDAVRAAECLPDAVRCTLCWELFCEPVTLECGHNYCSSCITQHWSGASASSCPQCHETIACRTQRPNRQLGNLVWLIKQLKTQEVVTVRKQGLCETHQLPRVLFCKDDKAFLCSDCGKSPAHSSHYVLFVELAAQEYKYEIKKLLEEQKCWRESLRAASADMQLEKQNLVSLVDEGVQKLGVEYKELLELVKTIQTEQLGLAKAIEKEVEEELANLYKSRCSLKKLSSELQRTYDLPAREFLQDIKQNMSKYRTESCQPLERPPPDLKEKLWDFARRNLYLQNTLRKCRDTLPLKLKVERAHVTLDPATACSQLLLSEDHKRVVYEPLVYRPVTEPLGFDIAPCVLGSEGFTSGRHYWEVEITASEGWALGIATECVRRKGVVTLGLHEGIWALQPEGSALLRLKEGTLRVRVYLHYEAGQLEFFDASSRNPIATFSSLCFGGERLFPFFLLEKQDSHLKLCF